MNKLLKILSRFRKPKSIDIGKAGEAIACRYLKLFGYAIVARNYITPLGEIDIIAEDGDVLVFVEVKMRRSDLYGLPEEAVNSRKMQKLTRLAQLYIKKKNLYDKEARFDIVSITAEGRFGKKNIRLIKNAFYIKE